MNHVTALLQTATSAEQFAQGYARYIVTLVQQLDTASIAAFIDLLEEAKREERTVFIAGNGGSASTASHMATDLGFGTRHGADALPLRVMSLTDNTAFLTAAANDEGYPDVFAS